MKELLRIDHLTKIYRPPARSVFHKRRDVRAVDDVSFSLYQGESLGLVGESGSGKTTIAKMIMGLVKPTAGEIYYEDTNLLTLKGQARKEMKKKIQIVFQDPYSSLNPKKTIGWSLGEALDIHRVGTKEERRQAVENLLLEVGLPGAYSTHFPSELSGGQRQRVAIAQALILRPEIVIIDEGVSALDVSIQASILNLLKELQAKYNLTYIFISHDLNVIEYFCDRVAVLYRGKLVELFKPEEYMSTPHDPYTEKLFRAAMDPLDKRSAKKENKKEK